MSNLVLGTSGLVGSHVFAALRALGEVTGTYRSEGREGLAALDITDRHAVIEFVTALRPQVIECAAAEPFVEGCERDPRGTREVNVTAVGHVAASAKRVEAVLVYLSSDYVFDGTAAPYSEDDPTSPINEYGRQKVEAERIVAAREPSLICRTSGVFGWEKRRKNFACQVIDRLRMGRELLVADDQILCPTFAPDLAHALVSLITRRAQGVVHVAGP